MNDNEVQRMFAMITKEQIILGATVCISKLRNEVRFWRYSEFGFMFIALALLLITSGAKANGLENALKFSGPIVANKANVGMVKSDCTGTAIGRNAILTATHCFTDVKPWDSVIYKTGLYKIVDRVDDGNDHTILFLDNDTFLKAKYPRFCEVLPQGSEVVINGNPRGYQNLIRNGYYSGKIQVENQVAYMFDMNNFPGDSGSALFSTEGCIAGVLSAVSAELSRGIYFKQSVSFPLAFTNQQLSRIQK